MNRLLPIVLGICAGYVDTTGFLALHGLFASHVTGNFVTLGASVMLGTTGVLAKLLALPVFCVVVMLATWLGSALEGTRLGALRTLFAVEFAFLALGAWLAFRLGPFPDGDAWPALSLGGALVAAMAIQNAAQRLHMPADPPTTVMTGTTTQIMIDVANLLRRGSPEARRSTGARLRKMGLSVVSFAAGCAAGAAAFHTYPELCFAAPPALAALALALPGPRPAPTPA
jgi:uncharacterized membrane protein YoaK (UPF0700 family)